jgi:hypothetical protein
MDTTGPAQSCQHCMHGLSIGPIGLHVDRGVTVWIDEFSCDHVVDEYVFSGGQRGLTLPAYILSRCQIDEQMYWTAVIDLSSYMRKLSFLYIVTGKREKSAKHA